MPDETRQVDFNSCPSGELEETTRTPSYYVDDYPTRAKIQKRPAKEAISVSQNCPLWSRAIVVMKTKTRTIALRSMSTKTRTVTICETKKRYKNIKLQWEKMNENENLLQTKKQKLKIWANHTAILCQPDVTQQCERKLASSSSTDNSGVVLMISRLKANEHGHVNR